VTALLFPGQGSQRPNLMGELARTSLGADLLVRASAALARDVLAEAATAGEQRGDLLQLAFYLRGVASARALERAHVGIDAVAGHSVGAFAAAVAADALAFEDGARLVALRGETMAAAFPSGFGMAAIVGLDEVDVARVVARSAGDDALFVTNVNAPDNISISGTSAAIERALVAAAGVGARSVRRLDVSVPSHSPLLNQTRDVLARALSVVDVRSPSRVLVGGIDGRVLRDARAIREELSGGVAAPVRWADATRVLYERGVRLFVEAPPGDVLTRLASAAFPSARAVALDDCSVSSVAALVGAKP